MCPSRLSPAPATDSSSETEWLFELKQSTRREVLGKNRNYHKTKMPWRLAGVAVLDDGKKLFASVASDIPKQQRSRSGVSGSSSPPGGTGESGSGDPFHGLMDELTSCQRIPTDAEMDLTRRHVARVGFGPNAREQARCELAGGIWKGRVLTGRDMLPPDERHFVKHVQKRQEWPVARDQWI